MTQMLLFDSVTETAAPVIAPVIAPAIVPAIAPSVANQRKSAVNSAQIKRTEAKQADGGLNHMGDLARLVLMRYDLVAQRREEMAARRRAR